VANRGETCHFLPKGGKEWQKERVSRDRFY